MRIHRYAWAAAGIAAAITLSACTASSGGTTGGTDTSTTTTTSTSTTTEPSGSSAPSTSSSGGGGTLKVAVGTFPDNLDPSIGYTTQAAEGDNMVYTPLLAYAPKAGAAGTKLIPGLATALPKITNGGLTYTLQLRKNLKYSDGTAVKASDFPFAVQRAIKLSWGGASFFTGYIKGAADYAANKAQSISGIKADDSSGAITITLTQPYGAFANLLAFIASAPIPSSTPVKPQPNTPPAGVGPYKFSNVNAPNSYTLVKNPMWASAGISAIPAGYVDEVDVNVQSNTLNEAQSVLTNQADIFDPGDAIPASILAQVRSQAASRYQIEKLASTYYFFMNTQVAPFNNKQARLAVNMALDRTALQTLSSGQLTPGCFFLPPPIVGHPSGNCVSGDPTQKPSSDEVAQAKQMIANAGLAGSKVTVWSEERDPRDKFCAYYADLLNQLGFQATIKSVSDTAYFTTIGNRSNNAQTGFADWSQDFPNPADFYLLLSKAAIQNTNNENFGNVDDPTIESSLKKLTAVPATKLQSSAAGWAKLDKYVDAQGYTATFGYATAPKFMSSRVDFNSAVFHTVNYILFNTVKLNS